MPPAGSARLLLGLSRLLLACRTIQGILEFRERGSILEYRDRKGRLDGREDFAILGLEYPTPRSSASGNPETTSGQMAPPKC
jgi:hypothetical protein